MSELWKQYERIIKDNGAIVLTAQTPFDKVLGVSNLRLLKYELKPFDFHAKGVKIRLRLSEIHISEINQPQGFVRPPPELPEPAVSFVPPVIVPPVP